MREVRSGSHGVAARVRQACDCKYRGGQLCFFPPSSSGALYANPGVLASRPARQRAFAVLLVSLKLSPARCLQPVGLHGYRLRPKGPFRPEPRMPPLRKGCGEGCTDETSCRPSSVERGANCAIRLGLRAVPRRILMVDQVEAARKKKKAGTIGMSSILSRDRRARSVTRRPCFVVLFACLFFFFEGGSICVTLLSNPHVCGIDAVPQSAFLPPHTLPQYSLLCRAPAHFWAVKNLSPLA